LCFGRQGAVSPHGGRLLFATTSSSAPGRALSLLPCAIRQRDELAHGVLQLVGEGRLSLQDTVERWLPGRVPDGGNITLRQLLTHTSGLADYFGHPGFFDPFFAGDLQHVWTAADLLAAAVAEPPDFAPGTSWHYSNTGYMLLGHIVQAATGDSIDAQLQRRIIRPLRLEHTSFDLEPQIAGHHAHGYSREASAAGELVDVTDWSPSYAWSAGAIISTADDTASFYGALLGGRLLRPDLLAQMKTTVPMGLPDESYGLGLWHTRSVVIPGSRFSCGAMWGHDGDILGYHADAFSRTDRPRVVVLLGSYSKDESDLATQHAQFDVLDTALCGAPPNGRTAYEDGVRD
jgi:D-alanyl-D-alanine carboxypeptidase